MKLKFKHIIFLILFVAFNKVYAIDVDSLKENKLKINNSSYLGVEAGSNFNFFSQDIEGLQKDSRNKIFESGFGVAYFIGTVFDMDINEKIGINVKLAAEQKNYANTGNAVVVIDAFTNGTTEIKITNQYSVFNSYLSFSPKIRWNYSKKFFLLFGPIVNYSIIEADLYYKENIISSNSMANYNKFIDNVQYGPYHLPHNSTRTGISLDVGFRKELGTQTLIIPKIEFQYMFTDFAGTEKDIDNTRGQYEGYSNLTFKNKILHTIQISIAIWFKL